MKTEAVTANHESSEYPPGLGVRQSSGAFASPDVRQAAEDCRSPRR